MFLKQVRQCQSCKQTYVYYPLELNILVTNIYPNFHIYHFDMICEIPMVPIWHLRLLSVGGTRRSGAINSIVLELIGIKFIWVFKIFEIIDNLWVGEV